MSMSLPEIRALFPALQNHVWLNAAASSPLPLPVTQALHAYNEEASQRGDLGFAKWLSMKETTRARLAGFIKAGAHELAYVPSTSFAFHIIGSMLKARGIREVVTLEAEFPSTTLPLLHAGLELQVVKAAVDGSFSVEAIARAITPQTGAIAVSVVQFSSGFRVDLEALSALCKARQLPLILNAAQALGQVPLDVKALGVAFLAAPSHKWFMAGYGMGLMFIDEAWLDGPLPISGWLSVPPAHLWKAFHGATLRDDGPSFHAVGASFRKEASAIEAGGANWGGMIALDAALTLHERIGVEHTLQHNIALQMKLRTQLRQRGFTPNAPDDEKNLSGICVVPVQGDPNEVVRSLIREAHIVTTARGVGVRISTHLFNSADDIEQLIAAIDRLAIRPG